MAERLADRDLVSFKEMLMANSKMVDALCQLLIEKGIFTEEEFYSKLKKVQVQYQNKKGKTTQQELGESKILTLGSAGRRTQFTYTGNVKSGVTIDFKGKPRVSGDFFQALLKKFSGQTIPGGFNMTDPKPGGLGEWVQRNSSGLNPVHLTPRHASFIAAVLEHEGYITCSLGGNTVSLHFKKQC